MLFQARYKILVFLLPYFGVIHADQPQEKPFVVLITSYNNSEWVEKNLKSVAKQLYTNYRVIYVDDCSTDGTAILAKGLVEMLDLESRFTLISNRQRKGALQNIYNAVHSCRDDEIIVSLDGDDWFPSCNVLNIINNAYSFPSVWITHGTLNEYPSNFSSWCIPIPDEIVQGNLFRVYRCPSHLRTFYAWLFKKIDVNDLNYEGQFFPMTWDQAIMFPMMEMAGERHAFIDDITYIYNTANQINDNKVNAQLQNKLEKVIRAMPPYQRLDKSPLD